MDIYILTYIKRWTSVKQNVGISVLWLLKLTTTNVSVNQSLFYDVAMNSFAWNSQDYLLFYGIVDKCPVCGGTLEYNGIRYSCTGSYSEWASCTFSTRDPPWKEEPIKLPDSVLDTPIADVGLHNLLEQFFPNFLLFLVRFEATLLHFLCQLLKKYQDPTRRPHKNMMITDKPFKGMAISLMGRLSRTHVCQYS